MKNTIVELVKTALINSGRARARAELLRMSDHVLEDAGFSRALLMQGNQAWPWRINDDAMAHSTTPIVAQRPASATRTERKAIEELRRLSNAELADIGITRGDIEQVVRHGREGVAQNRFQSAA